jgi:hypothetical protein
VALLMTISEARRVFAHLMTLARTRHLTTTEKAQLSYARQKLRSNLKGARRNPVKKRRTTAKARKNPSGLIRMGKLVEIRYYRDHGAQKGFYKHPFKVRPTIYYRASDNSIFIKG